MNLEMLVFKFKVTVLKDTEKMFSFSLLQFLKKEKAIPRELMSDMRIWESTIT